MKFLKYAPERDGGGMQPVAENGGCSPAHLKKRGQLGLKWHFVKHLFISRVHFSSDFNGVFLNRKLTAWQCSMHNVGIYQVSDTGSGEPLVCHAVVILCYSLYSLHVVI